MRFPDLDDDQRRALANHQRLFQKVSEQLGSFIYDDSKLKKEIRPSSDHFFHNQKRLPHARDEQDLKLAFGRFTEWFAYERTSRSYRRRPVDVFLARLPDGEERIAAEKLTRSVLDAFAVRDVAAGCGLVLQSLATGQTFEIFERSASQQLVRGAVLMGRIFPLDDRFWTISAFMIPLNNERASDELAADLARLSPEKRQVKSQRDYEALLMGRAREAVTFEEREEMPAALIEPRLRELLEEAGAELDIDELRAQISRSRHPLDVLNATFRNARFVNEEHLQETAELLFQLWNATPRPELSGRSPREMNRLSPIGPRERQLAAEFAESIRPDIESGRFDLSPARRRAAIAKRQKIWLSTPRPDLQGMTPSDIIALERAAMMDRDLAPSTALPLQKVSRNAPCPCGSGKRYKRCCLSKQH